MKKLLVIGATGNIGTAVIDALLAHSNKEEVQIVAGCRNIAKAKKNFPTWYNQVQWLSMDLENTATFEEELSTINCVFLLRPPHLADMKIFQPIIDLFVKNNIKEIVFLSVQGVEKSTIIPHYKIEQSIKQSGLEYVFIRPSYFMQNLITELLADIKHKKAIVLPAGNAKFNWVDVQNIGEAIAEIIHNFDPYCNQAIEITGKENKNFEAVATLLSSIIGIQISYKSVNPFQFFFIKKKEGIPFGKILVLFMLHFIARFEPEPIISDNYTKITGKQPTLLAQFIEREKQHFVQGN